MKQVGLAACLLLAACGGGQDKESEDVASPAAARAADISNADNKLVVKPWDGELPRNTNTNEGDGYCDEYVVKPETAAGRLVEARGWLVTGEVPFGKYQAVSFAEELYPGMSALCLAAGGKIGVFDGERLVAMVADETDPAYGGLGLVSSIPNSSSVRIHDRTLGYPRPMADFVVSNGEVRVVEIAEFDLVCAPDIRLPTTFGLSVHEARKRMVARGWVPIDHRSEHSPERQGLMPDGVIETDDCAGTGLGPCAFDYAHPGGAAVEMYSVSEQFTIRGYSYSCNSN